MIKLVNGVEVELTPEEIAERLAEEAAWVPPPEAPLKTLGDVIDVVIAELAARGPAVTPEFSALLAEVADVG